MTITKIGLDAAETFATDYFDVGTYMSVGSGTGVEAAVNTVMSNETVRNAITSTVKNSVEGYTIVRLTLGLSDAGGTTITEVGLHTAATDGTMLVRELLTTPVAKTSAELMIIDIVVEAEASNN